MANVVEILIRARDEASRVLQRVAGETSALSATAGRLAGPGALGAVVITATATAGAIFVMGRRFADMTEQLERLSARTGVASRDLQILREILREGGGDAEALTLALQFLNRSIATGDPVLKQLGITTQDVGEAFRQLIDILSRSSDKAKVTEVAMRLMGRGAGEILPHLKAISTEFESMGAVLDRTGGIVDEKMQGIGKILDAQLDSIGRNWRAAWLQMQFFAGVALSAALARLGALTAASRFQGLSTLRAEPGNVPSGGPDPLTRVTLREPTEEQKRRAKELAEIIDLLGVTEREGRRVLAILDEITRSKKIAALRETLGIRELVAPEIRPPEAVETMRPDEMLNRIMAAVDPIGEAMRNMRREWAQTFAEMSSAAAIESAKIELTLRSLSNAFATIFDEIIAGTKRGTEVLLDIVKAFVRDVLVQFARLAAIELVKRIFNLGFPTSLPVPAGIPGEVPPGRSASTFPGSGAEALARGSTVNFTINAIDSQSIADQFASGSIYSYLRRARNRSSL